MNDTLIGIIIGWLLSTLTSYTTWKYKHKIQARGCVNVLLLAIKYDRLEIYDPNYLPNISNPYWCNHVTVLFTTDHKSTQIYADWAEYCSKTETK